MEVITVLTSLLLNKHLCQAKQFNLLLGFENWNVLLANSSSSECYPVHSRQDKAKGEAKVGIGG